MRAHGNLCVLPTASVDRCDSPAARLAVLRGGHAARRAWERDALEAQACCPRLDPGDAVFYREDVAHRTQDEEVDRLSMVIQVQTARPRDADPGRDDARCGGWAARGACAAHPEFMRCVCAKACATTAEEEGGGDDG